MTTLPPPTAVLPPPVILPESLREGDFTTVDVTELRSFAHCDNWRLVALVPTITVRNEWDRNTGRDIPKERQTILCILHRHADASKAALVQEVDSLRVQLAHARAEAETKTVANAAATEEAKRTKALLDEGREALSKAKDQSAKMEPLLASTREAMRRLRAAFGEKAFDEVIPKGEQKW